MPCPHNEITIVQRSQRQSAVAAAAYQSGEKLFCEYDQQVKHYPEKRGIVHNEILLPANAPLEYADRNILWNAAEAVEKQWNSQLARRWVLTIPREIPPDQYAVLVREFCEQQFVSKGMIADFAIHDPHPPGHNPHAHVLLTMRAMDEHGKWLPKAARFMTLTRTGNGSSCHPAGGKATRRIRWTGTTRSIVKSGGMNGRSSRTAIWKPMTARSVWTCVPMPDRGLILSLLSMRGPLSGRWKSVVSRRISAT